MRSIDTVREKVEPRVQLCTMNDAPDTFGCINRKEPLTTTPQSLSFEIGAYLWEDFPSEIVSLRSTRAAQQGGN